MFKKRILLLVIVVVLLVAGIIIWTLLQPKRNVLITMSPTKATVKLDGKQTVNSSGFHTTNGKHFIDVSMNGFGSKHIEFNAGNSPITLTIFLPVTSQAGTDYLSAHRSQEGAIRDTLGSQLFNQASEERAKALPLMSDLPHIDNYYRVDYGASKKHPDDDTAVALYITLYAPEGEQQALDWLKFKGYTPDKYEMIFEKSYGLDDN